MNRREAVNGRLDSDLDPVVLILPDSGIRLGRKRKDRVLHRGHVGLRHSVQDVAHEEIALRIPIRQERATVYYMVVRHGAAFRTFTHSRAGYAQNPR